MTILYLAGRMMKGTAAERTGTTWTNLSIGWTYIETDTGLMFNWTGSAWTAIGGAGGGGGEANTASNLGAGQGVFKSKVSLDLQFRSLTATSSKIALANNTNDVGIDVTEANLTLSNMTGPLSVAKGGTGAATLTGILKGAGTSAITAAALLAVADGGTGVGSLSGIISGNGTSAFTASNTLAGTTLTTPVINGVTFGDVGITNASSPYTVLATTGVIRADASAGAITVNLPTAVGIAGREYHIFRTDITQSTNLITIDGNGTETIDSNLTYTLYPAEWIKLESDGANWQVIGRSAVSWRQYIPKGSTLNRSFVAGYGGTVQNIGASTTSPAANTLWAMPLVIERTIKCDLIRFRVTTLSSGAARAGIYRDNGNSYPGALIFDTGSIDTSTGSIASQRDTTITSSLQIFQPGLYWLAWETNSATGQYGTPTTGNAVSGFLGHETALGATNVGYGYSVAHTFGALPDPYTAGGSLLTTAVAATNPIVAVALRPI